MAAIPLCYFPAAPAPCSRHRERWRGAARPGGTGLMGRLDGKIALISGTARGMGRAAALEFAAQGAAGFGCDLDERAGAEAVDMVTAAGGRMAALAPVDLGQRRGRPGLGRRGGSTTRTGRC